MAAITNQIFYISVSFNGFQLLFIAGAKLLPAEKDLIDESQEKDNSIKEEQEEETIILEDILAHVKKETVVTKKTEENKEHDQVLFSVFDALELYTYIQQKYCIESWPFLFTH